MGSRILAIPRRRVRELFRTAEELGSAASYSSGYIHRHRSRVLPTLVDHVLSDQKEREETTRTTLDERFEIALSGRSLHVQDGTIWKQHVGVAHGLWGQGPEGKRWLATYTRVTEEAARASNAATAIRYDDEEENTQNSKKEKEPSPEDCDEAVEDLSSVKAKHKQSQEAPKTKDAVKKPGDGWMVKARNVFFGIGPAIRAVLAMSRCA